MKIYLNEIAEQETELDFTEKEKWVLDAVSKVDEHLEEFSPSQTLTSGTPLAPKSRPVKTHLSLRKVDDVVVLTGDLNTQVELICSRCTTAFQMPCQSKLSALFCKDPVMAGVAHLQPSRHDRDQLKPVGQNKGFARHAHDSTQDDALEEGKDLDITYLSEDFINLADVLTEQLQLQIPFQPLCRESCKGMCAHCGADLNVGRCACSKLTENLPFTALRSLKIQ